MPYNNVEKENKVLTGLEKFGNKIKDGAFFVGKKIKEKVSNPALAEYYCIKSDNKSGSGIKIIDLPAENIVIR